MQPFTGIDLYFPVSFKINIVIGHFVDCECLKRGLYDKVVCAMTFLHVFSVNSR